MPQFLSLRNIFFLFVLFIISACVSTKKFEAQTQQLQQTNQKLEQFEAEHKAIETRLSASQDSLRYLKSELQQNQIRSEYNVYKTAREAGDYQSASVCLLRLVEADTTQSYWVYDSLAFYHYLYLNTPGNNFLSPAALYYAEKGLALKPDNVFLLEIKGKSLLAMQNDTTPYRIFTELWKKTGDLTFLWNLAYMNLAVYQDVKKTESIISEVLKSEEASVKRIRITQIEERRIDLLPARAGFLFLRGMMQANLGQFQKAAKTMEEVLKIAPEYHTARRYLYDLRNVQKR